MNKVIYILFLTWAISCAVNQRAEEKPNHPAQNQSVELAWQNAEWDRYLYNAIATYGHNLLTIKPGDHLEFSDNYPVAISDIGLFWAKIFVVLAKYESNWNPQTKYQEKFPDAKGKRVVSRGLFQISKESTEQARYGCKWKNEEELHDAQKNIECAVKVADALFGADKRIGGKVGGSWKGLARYWSAVRGVGSDNSRKALEAIKGANR